MDSWTCGSLNLAAPAEAEASLSQTGSREYLVSFLWLDYIELGKFNYYKDIYLYTLQYTNQYILQNLGEPSLGLQ